MVTNGTRSKGSVLSLICSFKRHEAWMVDTCTSAAREVVSSEVETTLLEMPVAVVDSNMTDIVVSLLTVGVVDTV